MTPAPHADITGDGLVSTGDFNFIQIHFLEVSDMGCTSLHYGSAGKDPANHRPQFEGPLRRISVAELRNRGLHDLVIADLNHDKWVDQHDIAAFLAGARP